MPKRKLSVPESKSNIRSVADFFTPIQNPAGDDNDVAECSNVAQSKHNHISVDLTIEQVQNEHGINRALFLLFDFDFQIIGTSSSQISCDNVNETAASTNPIASSSKKTTNSTHFQFRIETTVDSHSDSDDEIDNEGNEDGTDGKSEWILIRLLLSIILVKIGSQNMKNIYNFFSSRSGCIHGQKQ